MALLRQHQLKRGMANMADSSVAPKRVYRSIFLDEDWAHQKYFGWDIVEERAGLRLLRKKRSAFARSLLLLNKAGEGRLAEAVTRGFGFAPLTDMVIHDFDGILPETPVIAGRHFYRAEQRERLLNIATYVIDLEQHEDALWKNLGPKSRNAVRKAEKDGVRFVCDSDFDTITSWFYDLYAPVARQKGLELPSLDTLKSMQHGGNLICVAAEQSNGETMSVNIMYVSGKSVYFLHGANHPAISTGVGQFIQWTSILLLKKLGYTWYDLGGVQDQANVDGIREFKKSLGGVFHTLGDEFRSESLGFGLARTCLLPLRKKIRLLGRSSELRRAVW